jgi:hypothetical protein
VTCRGLVTFLLCGHGRLADRPYSLAFDSQVTPSRPIERRLAAHAGLGFELDYFVAFFVLTAMVCLAWPRPFVVGGVLIVIGALLKGLQLLTPDRSANLLRAIYSAAGAFRRRCHWRHAGLHAIADTMSVCSKSAPMNSSDSPVVFASV